MEIYKKPPFLSLLISNIKKYLSNTKFRCVLLSALITAAVYIDPGNQMLVFERKTMDARYRFYARPTVHTKDIIILDISEDSIKQFEPVYGTWPWPRSVHGEVVDYLAKDGARAVAFDLIFAEHTSRQEVDSNLVGELRAYALNADIPEIKKYLIHKLDSLRPESGDASFTSAVSKAKNVFQTAVFYLDENEFSLNPGLGADDSAALRIRSALLNSAVPLKYKYQMPLFFNVTTPFPALSDASRGIGHINFVPDKDGPCRRFLPLVAFRDNSVTYPAFAITIAAYAKGVPVEKIRVEKGKIIIGDSVIPLLPDGSAFISYQGGEIAKQKFGEATYRSYYQYLPYHYVIASKDLLAMGREPAIPEGFFKNKIVLIGSTAAGLKDVRTTPFSSLSPGVEIHANIIDNILTNKFLMPMPEHYEVMYVLLLALTIAFVTSARGPYSGFLTVLIAGVSVIAIHWKFFDLGIVLPLVRPAIAMLGSYLGVLLLKYAIEKQEKTFIKSAFGRYLAAAVLEDVLKSPEKLKLGGEKRYMTILFSDIEGFTSFSEHLAAEDVVAMLNEYLTAMVKCIADTGGTLDKFVGDAILAEWNAPANQEDHAACACETALLMTDSLKTLREKWLKEGKPLINIRIGINTGEMIVGNMGTENIFDYTVIGNEVNTAARFEALNKDFGTRIIIAESTYREAERHRPGEFIVRNLARVAVKGRQASVVVYELVGRKDGIKEEKLAAIEKFKMGLDLFMEQRFSDAGKCFGEALRLDPDDAPSKTYMTLCNKYENNPPHQGWKGVYVQISK